MPRQFHVARPSFPPGIAPDRPPLRKRTGRGGASTQMQALSILAAALSRGNKTRRRMPTRIPSPHRKLDSLWGYPRSPRRRVAATSVGGLPLTANGRKHKACTGDGVAHAMIEISLSPLPPSALPMPAFLGVPSGVAANRLTLRAQARLKNGQWI